MTTSSQERRWWTEEEDNILRQEGELQQTQGSLKNWNAIAAKLPGRTNKDCRKRWHKIEPNIRKGAWTAAEHTRLQEAVDLFGLRQVNTQCAKRWGYALDPALSHTPWTEAQDEHLLRAINEHGHNWTKISGTVFQDRSTVNIKNRYFVLKRQQQSRSSSAGLPFPVDEDNLSELSWSDFNERDDQVNATALGIDQSETINGNHLGEIAVSNQTSLDLDMGAPASAPPLDLGDYFNFSDSLIAPYEDGISTHPIGDYNVESMNPAPVPEASLAMDAATTDGGGVASSQVGTATGNATGRSNHTVDEPSYRTDQSTTVESARADPGSPSRLSTLTLENVHPQTVNLVLNTLLSSNASFQMRLDNN
ncbi:MAG: hypothetical protein L6R36_003822 [Xanthoria steineri]|nr:MAG: hypothetical protein L6R36_003822 [Xanthoria steineri]